MSSTKRKTLKRKTFDLVGSIVAFEDGSMPADRIVPFFQHLIDSGLAWSLQGFYGRAARSLIESGECHV